MQVEVAAEKGVAPLVMASPSFPEPDEGFVSAFHRDSPQKIPAAPHRLLQPPPPSDASDDDDDDFEFAFVINDPQTGPGITADEIFSNGQIRPIYPVFDRALLLADDDYNAAPTAPAEEGEQKAPPVRGTLRRLLIEERQENSGSASSSSSSLGADELEGVQPGTYCVWAPRLAGPSPSPSPSRCKKSSSTGSSLRWRLRDLVVGRSQSDGKEKFVFLAAEEKKESPSRAAKGEVAKARARARGKGHKATEVDAATAHGIYYGKGGGPAGSGAARRSFLPYKQELVGFFANVNGLGRTHHPF